MSIQLITFDLDDTLWESRPVLLSAERAMLEWLAEQRPRLLQQFSPEQLRIFKNQVAEQNPELLHRVSALRREALRLAQLEAGYSPQEAEVGADEAFAVFYRARQQVRFFDSVIPTLEALQGHYRLGAITNGNADLQHIGLMQYFDFALCAEDLGSRKPAPELFQAALARAGCRAEQAVHVGDHPIDDMEGAHACGFRTVWANFQDLQWSADWKPDAQIRHWRELIEVLRQLG